MRGKDGAVVEETEQILEVLAKHWEELGKSRNSLDPEQEPELVHESSDLCQEIGWEEVVRVLKTLKRGKAPGPDGILNEMLTVGRGGNPWGDGMEKVRRKKRGEEDVVWAEILGAR